MEADLRWLAENVTEWPIYGHWVARVETRRGIEALFWQKDLKPEVYNAFTYHDLQCARYQLGLDSEPKRDLYEELKEGFEALRNMREIESTEAEEEAFKDLERKLNEAQAGKDVDRKQEGNKRSKYHVKIKPGVWVDVYDVLKAYKVTNPADAHAIKKMLMPGQRGAKDAAQDRQEAIDSLVRAGELEE